MTRRRAARSSAVKPFRHRREERGDGVRRKPHARHATRQRRRREGRAASRRSGRSSRPGFNSGVGRRGRGDPRADADTDADVGIVVSELVSELVPKLGRRRFVKIVKPDPHVGIRPNPRAAWQSRAPVVTPHDAKHRRDLRRVAARDRRHRDGVQSGAIARESRQLARRVCSRFFQFFFYFYPRASLGRLVRGAHRTLSLVLRGFVVHRRLRMVLVHPGFEPGTAGRAPGARLRGRLLDEPEGLAGVVAEQPGDLGVVSAVITGRVAGECSEAEAEPERSVVTVRALHRREDAVEVHGDELGGGGGQRRTLNVKRRTNLNGSKRLYGGGGGDGAGANGGSRGRQRPQLARLRGDERGGVGRPLLTVSDRF
mmetsp:Transcript_6330/g.24421  ORF Transcript_6330/g.24421 Transcript_6330/m.24421 type:complete len:370 (-) Transcript_6330:3328-4437(-)